MESKKIVELIKESVLFLAENDIIVVFGIERGGDRTLLHQSFDLKNNAVYMGCERFRCISIENKSFWFKNGNIENFEFEEESKMLTLLDERIKSLSKNKLKLLIKNIKSIEEKQNPKTIETFFKFLRTNLSMVPSTSYGFDGGRIIIQAIRPYNNLGREKKEVRESIKSNIERMKSLQREMNLLEEKQKQLKEKEKEVKLGKIW